MRLITAALTGFLALAAAGSALAQAQAPGPRPPVDAIPLPILLEQVQAREGVAYFDEVAWDDDGYWEIEFFTADGVEVEIRVDPLTGLTLPRG